MTSSGAHRAKSRGSRTVNWLLAAVLLLGVAHSARSDDCSDFPGGVLDGAAGTVPPVQLNIDQDCRVQNYTQSNPFDSNVNFDTDPGDPNSQRYLVIFNDVYFTGQMSCNDNHIHNHRLWFTNGTIATNLQPQCRDLFIPVEKIDKQNPAGQTTATIGVPFTYTHKMPVMWDPLTGTIISDQGSLDDLHGVTVIDDLNESAAALSYVSHVAYWEGSGTPLVEGTDYSFTNVGGRLTWEFGLFGIVIPAGEQIIIELTVVLDDDPANVNGLQFVNRATWDFGRLIDGVFYEPLPGENGVTPPLTIAAPELVVTKTGPATMNLGASGQFAVDAHNTGLGDAWNVTLLDRLPDGPTGGMCDVTPEVLSVTLAGSPLTAGSGYSLAFAGAPACQLTLTLLDAAGPIAPDAHLIVTYQARLDANTQNGATLTNVAGATQWFNGDATNTDRVSFTRTLTDGTVGTADHEDAHTVTVALVGNFFEKTVANLRSGADPTTVAAPGDTLRYTLRLQTTTEALTNFAIYDEMDALNAPAAFVRGSLNIVSALPAGAVNNSSATGGAQGTGVIDISNLSLPAGSELRIQFDITVAATVTLGTVITNQSQLRVDGAPFMVSDDPNVNGQADPFVAGDEDPTRVAVVLPTLVFQKTVATGATASPGDVVRYQLLVTNVSDVPLSGFSLVDQVDQLNDPAMFVPGTLALVTALPAGATNNSNPNGGAQGTGRLDIRNLSIGVAGSANESVTVEFTVQLAPVIANGTVVLNQTRLLVAGTELQKSDDPSVGGTEDPTRLVIQSAPLFRVQKISDDLSGDPAVLLAGETLRYTITVKNIGTDNATDAVLRDQIPVNTAYVAGSTTLNGAPVADVSGTSALTGGIQIHAPEDPTPGAMRADASNTPDNVATITFDVVVDPDVVDGTVISNQGFVSAVTGGVVDYPSDDPDTPIPNDPTRDVVGYLPLLFADKRAALQVDLGSPGIVDPGDVLRYTITVYNTGTIPATGTVLRDQVPANTTYVADSLTLNGLPVGRPDGGVSPILAGVDISSADLTPPLPAAGQGTLSPDQSAVIQFDLRVNDGVPGGTLIVNQAVVRSTELPDLLTDGDGNPATGPEPTVVIVGPGQQLSITKQVAVVGGGPAVAGATLEYLVLVTNISTMPAQYVVITDDLDATFPGYLSYVAQSATLNGATAPVSVAGAVITADYASTYGPLPPGEVAVLRFRAIINPTLAIGTTVTNTGVVTWNDPPQTAQASVSIDVGGMVGVGVLNGTVWHDADFDVTMDAGERVLESWSVELYRNDQLVHTALTDASGVYRISGVVPNYETADTYELRFTAPGAGSSTAKLGFADSDFTDYLQRIAEIVVRMGSNLQNLNLPIAPNGVVYNSIARTPIAGATLTLQDAGSNTTLPSDCFDDPAQQNQVTPADGWYRFDINFSGPSCPSGGAYLIEVTAPGSSYIAGPSEIIPPASDASTAAFSVPTCPGSASDAIPTTAEHCEVQISELAPAPSVPARTDGTLYHLHLALDSSQVPGSSQIFNNHVPIDPDLQGAIAITKTTPALNVTRGQLVPYTITFTNITSVPLFDVTVADRFPAGFRYIEGSARIDGVPTEPAVAGRQLTWSGLSVAGGQRRTLLLLLGVGAGVGEGEFVNRTQAVQGVTGNALSGEASATVRVIPDATFDCTDVTGKVFDDANRSGLQDEGERGLPGVRVATARGLNATTDSYGRYHITCAITPREGRGSNFVLKLDDRTLPSGYRQSTDQVRVQRATRGKALRINFAASIHRVVGLDIADPVFVPGEIELRRQWRPRMNLLLEELQKGPAVLRLSYLADVEDKDLVERRLEAMKNEIMAAWKALDCCYPLTIEQEVFWRKGGPPQPDMARMPESR